MLIGGAKVNEITCDHLFSKKFFLESVGPSTITAEFKRHQQGQLLG
jgi:hypothetical protein